MGLESKLQDKLEEVYKDVSEKLLTDYGIKIHGDDVYCIHIALEGMLSSDSSGSDWDGKQLIRSFFNRHNIQNKDEVLVDILRICQKHLYEFTRIREEIKKEDQEAVDYYKLLCPEDCALTEVELARLKLLGYGVLPQQGESIDQNIEGICSKQEKIDARRERKIKIGNTIEDRKQQALKELVSKMIEFGICKEDIYSYIDENSTNLIYYSLNSIRSQIIFRKLCVKNNISDKNIESLQQVVKGIFRKYGADLLEQQAFERDPLYWNKLGNGIL